MREYKLLPPPRHSTKEEQTRWLLNELKRIENGIRETDAARIADAYTVSNFTETRTLDASTATLGDMLDVFCTFIDDLKNRGTRRGTYDG